MSSFFQVRGVKRSTTEVPSPSPKKVRTESGDSTDSGLGEREKPNLSLPDTTPTDPPANEEVGVRDVERLSHSLGGEIGGGARLSHSLPLPRLSHSLPHPRPSRSPSCHYRPVWCFPSGKLIW